MTRKEIYNHKWKEGEAVWAIEKSRVLEYRVSSVFRDLDDYLYIELSLTEKSRKIAKEVEEFAEIYCWQYYANYDFGGTFLVKNIFLSDIKAERELKKRIKNDS